MRWFTAFRSSLGVLSTDGMVIATIVFATKKVCEEYFTIDICRTRNMIKSDASQIFLTCLMS